MRTRIDSLILTIFSQKALPNFWSSDSYFDLLTWFSKRSVSFKDFLNFNVWTSASKHLHQTRTKDQTKQSDLKRQNRRSRCSRSRRFSSRWFSSRWFSGWFSGWFSRCSPQKDHNLKVKINCIHHMSRRGMTVKPFRSPQAHSKQPKIWRAAEEKSRESRKSRKSLPTTLSTAMTCDCSSIKHFKAGQLVSIARATEISVFHSFLSLSIAFYLSVVGSLRLSPTLSLCSSLFLCIHLSLSIALWRSPSLSISFHRLHRPLPLLKFI